MNRLVRAGVALACAWSAAVVGVGPASAQPRAASAVQLLGQDFPDPGVLRADDGSYYAYSTSSGDLDGTIPYASAPSATGPWRIMGDALPTRPGWAADGGFWAPEVSRRDDGKYLMYFAAPTPPATPDNPHMCVGAAVADSPSGPFEPVGDAPLECRDGQGDIDPNGFTDPDGTRYLLYKSEATDATPATLWLQQVAADGVTPVGDRRELVHADRPDEDNDVVEAPTLSKRATRYVLFYAEGVYTEDYKTSYAWSTSLDGDWQKADRPLLTTDTFGGQVVGPGGADVTPADQDHIFFHGWLNGAHDRRGCYVTDLDWVDDLPVVAD